jgi:hypothetical protein
MQILERIHPICTPKYKKIITDSGAAVAVPWSGRYAFNQRLAPCLISCKSLIEMRERTIFKRTSKNIKANATSKIKQEK